MAELVIPDDLKEFHAWAKKWLPWAAERIESTARIDQLEAENKALREQVERYEYQIQRGYDALIASRKAANND